MEKKYINHKLNVFLEIKQLIISYSYFNVNSFKLSIQIWFP